MLFKYALELHLILSPVQKKQHRRGCRKTGWSGYLEWLMSRGVYGKDILSIIQFSYLNFLKNYYLKEGID